MRRDLPTFVLLACIGLVICLTGCGSSGGSGSTSPAEDPTVQAQAASVITPAAGGTVSTAKLYLTPYKQSIPGAPGKLIKVTRIRPEQIKLNAGTKATLTYTDSTPGPGAKLMVYRQDRVVRLVGEATRAGDEWSVEIGQLGIFFWVLETNFCLQFDGDDDHVNIPHSNSIKFDSDDAFTLECWFKSSETSTADPCTWGIIIGTWVGGTDGMPYPYNVRLWRGSCWADGYIDFAIYDGDIWDSASEADEPAIYVAGPYNDGQWHHFAGVRNGKSLMRVYVDGLRVASIVPQAALGTTLNMRPTTIGGNAMGFNNFNGCIDEVRIWKKNRSRAQIQADMNKRLTGTENGLVGLWNFDEGGGTVARDASSRRNDGSIVSDPKWVEADWPVTP